MIGNPDDILKFSPEDAKRIHAKTYIASNAALVVIGKADPGTIRNVYRRHFTKLPASLPQTALQSNFHSDSISLSRVLENISSDRFTFAKRVILEAEIPMEKLQLLTDILTECLSSTLPGGFAKPMQYDDFIASRINVSFDVVNEGEITFPRLSGTGRRHYD